jgi:hypothetical protein
VDKREASVVFWHAVMWYLGLRCWGTPL